MAGSNSAIGSFDSSTEEEDLVVPDEIVDAAPEDVLVDDGDPVRKVDAEPLQVDDVDVVPSLDECRNENRADVACASESEYLHARPEAADAARVRRYSASASSQHGMCSSPRARSLALSRHEFSGRTKCVW